MRAMQEWTEQISVMQQTVLISAVRSHDGFAKHHPTKALMRWFRRCVLISAFDGRAIGNPYECGGGSFTGPSCSVEGIDSTTLPRIRIVKRRWPLGNGIVYGNVEVPIWWEPMKRVVDDFMTARDSMSLHFYAHTMHAFQVIGEKHPDDLIRTFWKSVYERMVNALHLSSELVEDMDLRLGDNEEGWASRADEAGSCSA